MGAIILYLLACFGIGILAGLIIQVLKLTMRFIIQRIREKKKSVILEKGRRVLTEVMEKQKEQADSVDMGELEKIFGEQDLVEAELTQDGHVDPESLRILHSEGMDEQLRTFMDQHNGLAKIAV